MDLTFSAVGSALGKLLGPLYRFSKRPRIAFIAFDPSTDLRVWALVGPVSRTQKVFTIEVRNDGRDIARRCVGFLDIRPANAPRTSSKWYALHWADVAYAFRTTGADPIDIGPEGRRLDVVFSFQGQHTPGCWIATPSALVAPHMTPDHLPAGVYDAAIEVRSENAKTQRVHFKITSGSVWSDLGAVPQAG